MALTDAQKQTATQMLQDGVSDRVIARQLGISQDALRYFRRRELGIRKSGGAPSSGFTPEEIERLCTLWAEGHIVSDIGRMMGKTKGQIIGKAHRLGLAMRHNPIGTGRPKNRYPKPKTMAPKPPRVRESVPTASDIAELLDAPTAEEPPPPLVRQPAKLRTTIGKCKYPLWGDNERPTHEYCQCATMPGSWWCKEHRPICVESQYKSPKWNLGF